MHHHVGTALHVPWVLLALALHWRRTPDRSLWLWLLVAVGVSFDQTNGVRSRPYWGEALRASADKCITKHEEFAGIPTSPAPFGLVVSCFQVEQFASPSVRGAGQ